MVANAQMSNTWIAFPTTIYGSKKSLICAEILKIEQYSATGLIAGLYSWSSENADKNGLLENVSPAMLADALGWPKKKSAVLIKALENAGIIEVLGERTMLVNGWYEIGGKLVNAREKDAERKRTSRAAQQALSADCPTDVRRKSVATQHNTTVHNNISTDVDMYNGGEAAITRAQGAALNSPSDGQEKSKVQRSPKHRYGEYQHVLLTDDELSKLNETFGEAMTQKAITFLDEHIEMKGYKAKSHYLAIRKWVVDAVKEKERKDQRQPYRPATENKGTLYGRTIDEMGYDDPINKSMSFDVSYWATPEEKDNE